MKKLVLGLSMACTLLASCGKLDFNDQHNELPTITSTQNVILAAGQKITIELPTANADDAYAISAQGTSGAEVTVDGSTLTIVAPGVLPAALTDVVTASNEHDGKNNIGECGTNAGGNCGNNANTGIAAGGCMPGGNQNSGGKHHSDTKGHEDGSGDQHYIVNVNISYTGKILSQKTNQPG